MAKGAMKYVVLAVLVAGAFYLGQRNPTLFKTP